MHVFKKLRSRDEGMTTAEYAVGTCAAVGLGGVLLKLLTSERMIELLWSLLAKAFDFINPFW
jgi:hypothetical protein